MQVRGQLRFLILAALSAFAMTLVASPADAAAAVAADEQAGGPNVTFLDKAAAAKAIVDDGAEPYFDKLQTAEMSAKTGAPITGDTLDAQRAEARRRYAAAALDFTDRERDALAALVRKLHPVLVKDYPRLAKTPWSFLKLAATIEGGLPHTRGAHIVLSPPVLGGLVTMAGDAPERFALARGGGLLLHEQLHVFQRANPDLFAGLYTDVWRFRRAAHVDPGERLAKRIVVNPDAAESPWVFPIEEDGRTRWVWPALVFAADPGPDARLSFNNLRFVAVDVAAAEPEGAGADPGAGGTFVAVTGGGGEPVTRDLLSLDAFTSAFRPSTYVYHPNEAAADLFSRIVVAESLAPEPALFEEHRETVGPVRAWFRKNL
jgi:hypothetical protein